MKVVFTPIDDLYPMGLTIGKTYDVIKLDSRLSPAKDYYLLKNDNGEHYTYYKENFTELSVYRKNQIDKIILK